MNEEQGDQIIALLKEIRDEVVNIGFNTGDISCVKSNTDDAAEYLKNIKDNLGKG